MAYLKLITRGLTILETIHIISCSVRFNLSLLLRDTTNDPKDVRGTLIRTNLKMMKKIGEEVTHRNPNSSFYHGNERKHYLIFPS